MNKILTVLAIIALFAISCSTESIAPEFDNTDLSATALSTASVKSAEVDEEEAQEESQEEAQEGDAQEEEAEVEDEDEGKEEVFAEFVALHFPEVTIASISENEDCYEVRLEDGTQINFNPDLEWTKISCKHSSVYTAVPESVVPEEITAYVAENYPEETIMDIKKTGFGWMVTLNTKSKIKFNKDFSIK